MKIALIGYGKMGRMIESLCPDLGLEVVGVVGGVSDPLPASFDVAIDFTEPGAVVGNVRRVAERGKDLVIGTTGWADQLPEIKGIIEESRIGAVYSANFSVGVNIFLRVVEEAAALMRDRPEYESWGYEVHHSAKKDAPSGTLLAALDAMQSGGFEAKVDVASNRVGHVPGTHEIGFDSAVDSLSIKHVARNREGFARGALLAATLVKGQHGLLKFKDLL